MSSKRLATNNNQLPEGYKKTDIGVIPDDWEVVLLDSVAKRGSGHTPDKKHPEYWNGNIKWISLKDSDRLDVPYIDDTADKTTPLGIANSSAVVHPAGTVILSRDAGVGKSAIMRNEMAVSQHFIAWQCSTQLENHFLYYWLQVRKPEFERIAIGNTIKTIGLPYFKHLKIPFPPKKEEQKAIAQTLSDVDALIDELDKLIAKKRNIKTGTMQQLLTGKTRLPGLGEGKGYKKSAIGLIPEDWEVVLLSKLSHIATGQTPPTKNRNYYGYEYLFVSPADMGNAKYIINTLKKLSKLGFFICRIYPPMSILFTCISSTFGKCGIVTSESTSNQQINAIFPSELVNNEYLYYQLVRSAHRIKSKAGEQAVPIVNKTEFGATLVLVCSIEEQKAIAQVLSDIDTEITALEKRRAKTQAIKQGMMQELLTGRTRLKIEHPDDPITKNSNG